MCYLDRRSRFVLPLLLLPLVLLLASPGTADSQEGVVQQQKQVWDDWVRDQEIDSVLAKVLWSAHRATKAVIPSVVFISVEREAAGETPTQIQDLFGYFFDYDTPTPETPTPPGFGSGSGFVLDDEGYIITNHHVGDYFCLSGSKARECAASIKLKTADVKKGITDVEICISSFQ